MTPAGLPVDEGLLTRFRDAGRAIAWRLAPPPAPRSKRPRARIAHLHDEEARVESWGTDRNGGVEVDSGPLGALVLLLESDRRGASPAVEAREAGVDPAYPNGALRAVWGSRRAPGPGPTLRDLVDLARYALA